MHSSLIFLTIISIILIIAMITCFFCFIRSRRKEEEELMERIQYDSNQRQQQTQQYNYDQQQQQPQQYLINDQNLKQVPSLNSNDLSASNLNINNEPTNSSSNNNNPNRADRQQMNNYQVRNSYSIATNQSPYHATNQAAAAGSHQPQQDMSQQINSAVIGSTEAEFQNDFIQVFPMYQIAPLPEKNTTPYLL